MSNNWLCNCGHLRRKKGGGVKVLARRGVYLLSTDYCATFSCTIICIQVKALLTVATSKIYTGTAASRVYLRSRNAVQYIVLQHSPYDVL